MMRQHHITQSIVNYAMGRDSVLDLDGAGAIVLWVVDGLGMVQWRQADRHHWTSLLQTKPTPVTSAYPTTTATGLATLAFAAPPARHGALGYWIFLPEWGLPVNMLTGRDDHGIRVPEHLLYSPQTSIFSQLAAHDIASAVVSPELYRDSGLTRWLYAGARYCGYDYGHPETALTQVGSALELGVRFVWVYWPYFDSQAHQNGLAAAPTQAELHRLDATLTAARTRWAQHNPLGLVLTADHGMVALDPHRVVPRSDPRMTPVWTSLNAGERRAATTNLTAAQLNAWGTQTLGTTVLSQEMLWEEGWYGGPPASSALRQRVLTSLVLAPEGAQFEQESGRDTPVLRAAHGGVTPDEHTIPLWSAVWGG